MRVQQSGSPLMPESTQLRSQQTETGSSSAQGLFQELASIFIANLKANQAQPPDIAQQVLLAAIPATDSSPGRETLYQTLVEQIPAVIFMAALDGGVSEAYVSPHIEASLGFTREEWLDDPIRWYYQIHPDDRDRWSLEAAQTLLTGKAFRSSYRVLARDGHVVWFQCEAKVVTHPDGRPWFLQGVGFDISELKRTEEALQERSAALHYLSSHLMRLQDEERRRISRELHDGVGQYLAALKMNIDMLSDAGKNGVGTLVDDSRNIVDRCLSEVRTLSYLLHPPLLDEVGLKGAVRWLVEGLAERSGIKIQLELPDDLERLPSAIEIGLFRILQESLRNLHSHSGSTTAEIRFALDNGNITLEVRDRGKGIKPEVLQRFRNTGSHVGVGLSGMRERVNELGGKLDIVSNAEGTMIRVVLPISSQK
ncbi:MAG: domain S-box [Candidatus Sulfotelmatobacter sp.]|nr:domain S-box [Candidatus Sulfotelmatobacter sp.]